MSYVDEREDTRGGAATQRMGVREGGQHERIVTLYVVAQDGLMPAESLTFLPL